MDLTRTSDDAELERLPARPYPRLLAVAVVLAGALIAALWLLGTPPGLLGKADAVGYAICHRMAARSFHMHERPMALCARCTGAYLGVVAGLAMFAARGRLRAARLPPMRVLAILALAGATYGIDGLNSYLSLFDAYHPVYPPHNTLRLITGLAFGLAMITVVLPVYNALAWRHPAHDAPLRSLRDLGLLYGLGALVALAVLIDQALLLALFSLISAAGVVLMFGVIGSAAFLVAVQRENSAVSWRDLIVPAAVGVVFALAVIGGIDLARYLFTGTWEGFQVPG